MYWGIEIFVKVVWELKSVRGAHTLLATINSFYVSVLNYLCGSYQVFFETEMCSTSSLKERPKPTNMFSSDVCYTVSIHSKKSISINITYCPELDKVLKICCSYKKAVKQRVRQEQHEKLVVGEPHTVVHPVRRIRSRNVMKKGLILLEFLHRQKFPTFLGVIKQL